MRETKARRKLKNEKAITLIALVITVIVLLILAAVTISSLTGENGILSNATKSKEKTEIANEEEQVKLAAISALAENLGGEITETNLTTELDKTIGSGKYSISKDGDYFLVTYENSGRSYQVYKTGEVKNVTNNGGVETATLGDFYQNGGSIEVKFVDKENNIQENPIAPKLGTNMTPVKWNGTDWEETTSDDTSWYDYSNSQWANAVLKDESSNVIGYFVWIPRYAYKMTYTLQTYGTYNVQEDAMTLTADEFETNVDTNLNETYFSYANVSYPIYEETEVDKGKQTGSLYFLTYKKQEDGSYILDAYEADASTLSETKTTVGYSNNKGIVDKSGNVMVALENGIKTTGEYIVHPAFENNVDLGGWSEPIEGIWVAKYEMSYSDATSTEMGSGTTFKSVANVLSARSINIGNMYTYARNYSSENESHMLKSSEWGAVAYLSYSRYGTNGVEIDINDTGYITANKGATSSSTRNETGIYDLSGGAVKYVATYDKNGGTNLSDGNDSNNSNFATGTSTKYATAYSNGTNEYTGKKIIYNVAKTGDAVKEIFASLMFGWEYDYSTCVGAEGCFAGRGGGFDAEESAGIFFAGPGSGGTPSDVSFRVSLVAQ